MPGCWGCRRLIPLLGLVPFLVRALLGQVIRDFPTRKVPDAQVLPVERLQIDGRCYKPRSYYQRSSGRHASRSLRRRGDAPTQDWDA